MKKILPLLIVLTFFILPTRLLSQIFTATVTSYNTCFNQVLHAGVGIPPPGASYYGWTMTGGTITSVPSPTAVLTPTACGVATVVCTAYNFVGAYVSSVSLFINVACPNLIITPATQSICAGSSASLVVSGASSYTWSNSQNGSTITPAPSATTVYSVTGDQNPCVATSTVIVRNLAITATSPSVCAGSTVPLVASGSNTYTWTGSTLSSPVNQPSIAVGAGSYTVSTPAGPNVCTSTIAIGLAPDLTIDVSQNTFTTCIVQNLPYSASKGVTLSASGAQTYTWTGGLSPLTGAAVLVKPTVATCYTVTGTTASCSGSAIACVSVIPQFTFNVIHTMAPFGTYQPTNLFCRLVPSALNIVTISTLAIGPPSTFLYSWNFSPSMVPVSSLNTSTVLFTPLNTFTYTTEIADAESCLSSVRQATAYVAICELSSIELRNTQRTNAFFEVYPNPTTDKIFICSSEIRGPLIIQVMDTDGRILTGQEIESYDPSNPAFIDVGHLEKGLYFLNMNSNQKLLQSTKILKE